ncbi:cell division ATP-binding protein FtsE [Acetobacter pasteurianus NBRC 101655]|uniref:cell division ATP-binding protein FtsE n=1 Tax=Acetobacter pasteurianus TaxID=438 RepID=UPI0003843E96|nr:ATP-binding cassette domain-containing protein [Acetobacter pasteurianus]BAU38047.1 cell division ATP-binding protein FtsE [Acetobacter pasteurianus NBRC 101655]CCT60569.1 cell division ATP-binding protein FtsE [Acetobacter pasteurianus 386B]
MLCLSIDTPPASRLHCIHATIAPLYATSVLYGSSMIRLENVSWRRGKKQNTQVLSDLSFSIPQGGFRWLLGPSGAGKSSLLSLLHLETLPTEGRMLLLGKPVSKAEKRAHFVRLRQRIGMVHQDYKLIPGLSVADNVALPLRLQKRPEDEIQDEIHAILKWVGLGERLNAPAASLSGGEQQRTAIARAIIHRPSLILADEPTNALEESQAHRLLDMFAELSDMGTTMVVATHNEALIRRLERPALYLERGRLVQDEGATV